MHAVSPTVAPDLNAVLAALTAGIRATLGEVLLAVYLQGSWALGDADAYSDVDWLAVVARPLSAGEIAALEDLHRRLYALPSPWAQHLEGSYAPLDSIRADDPARTPWPYLDNGSQELVPSDHDNTRVVRWTLYECGVALWGPAPRTLIAPVPADALRAEVLATMASWGRDLLADPAPLDNRWYQAFAVLWYCRALHTLETGRVTSKRAAVEWAMEALEAPWAGLIARAWAERPNTWANVHLAADPDEAAETHAFIGYAVERVRQADRRPEE